MTGLMTPVFVEFIPEVFEEGKLYISQTYATAVHKCCCGCGHKVVTPLSPTGWRLTVEGEFVSLYPSIGNWGYPCQSHYWIRRNAVRWSYQMTPQEIEAGRRLDAKLKQSYFESGKAAAETEAATGKAIADGHLPEPSVWEQLKKWLFG
jgi:hypothetical protein